MELLGALRIIGETTRKESADTRAINLTFRLNDPCYLYLNRSSWTKNIFILFHEQSELLCGRPAPTNITHKK